MVGKIILCVILLLLAVVLFTPIRVRGAYDRGDITATLRVGPLKILLYPRPEKPEVEKKKAKKAKKAKKSAADETSEEAQTKPKKKFSINFDQILYSLEKLPPILGKALKRTGRRIRFAPLKVHLLVAGGDPADTALLYGKLEAVLAGGLPVLHRLVRIKDQDIRLFLDFTEENMDCIADVGIAIRLWDLLVIGVCAGASALKWFIGFRKLADKPSAGKHTEQPVSAEEADAA